MPIPEEIWKKYFHGYILHLLNTMQFQVEYEGICNGIALTGIFSFLNGDFLKFRELYHHLNDCRKNNPEDLVTLLKNITKKITHNRRTNTTSSLLAFSDEEKELKFIRAFLENIAISQEPSIYKEWFNGQYVNQSEGNIINRVVFAGNEVVSTLISITMYTRDELINYLDRLDKIAQAKKINIGLQLHSGKHAIGILSDAEMHTWTLIDANLPMVPNVPLPKLASIINGCFNGFSNIDNTPMIGFSSHIYCSVNDEKTLLSIIQELKNSDEYKSASYLSPEKVQFKSNTQDSLLWIAAKCGNTEIIHEARRLGANLDEQAEDGATAVYMVAQNGFLDALQVLSDIGADLDLANNDGTTPALVAALSNHSKVIFLLHKLGANLNKTDFKGTTLAIIAAQENCLETINVLDELKINLNICDKENVTPIYKAAKFNHPDMVCSLYNKGVKIDIQTSEGATPLYIAAQEGHTEVVELLCKFKADLDKASKMGATPAYAAAQNGYVEVLKILYNAGADFNKPTLQGAMPVHVAAQNKQVEVIRNLYGLGVDVDIPDAKRGMTPAYMAVYIGSLETVQVLAECGVDLTKPVKGKTLIELARERGHTQLVAYIKDLYKDKKTSASESDLSVFAPMAPDKKDALSETDTSNMNPKQPVN
jgi:ankyrin repeat protein